MIPKNKSISSSLELAARVYSGQLDPVPRRKSLKPLKDFREHSNAQNKTQRTKQYIKSLEERRKNKLFDRPKKVEELPGRERERLQQLFSIYADETSKNFRRPVKKMSNLPALPDLKGKPSCVQQINTTESQQGQSEALALPIITPIKAPSVRRKSTVQRLPSIRH